MFRLAFEIFVRTNQYYKIFGDDTRYFPHEMRQNAYKIYFENPTTTQKPSWGGYLVNLTKLDSKRRDFNWILDKIEELRKLSKEKKSLWYQLDQLNNKEKKLERIYDVAYKSTLPAKIKDSTLRKLDKGLSTAKIPFSCFPFVSAVFETGSVFLNDWNGYVPNIIVKMKVFKGILEWPGLFEENKSPN